MMSRNAVNEDGSCVEKQLLFVCANCKRKSNSEADNCTFKLCSGCYKIHYCNKECQVTDRKKHKVNCKPVKENGLNSVQKLPITDIHHLLHYCVKGNLEALRREISGGFDLRTASNEQLYIAFNNLIFGRFYECTELFLQHNANPNAYEVERYTPLYVACVTGFAEFVSLLLQYNADPNIRAIDGFTPLLMACQKGYDGCASLLLQHNVDPNIVVYLDGTVPLHLACQNGHDKCVSLLLQYKADPNITSKHEASSLHFACQHGHDKCVSLLLQNNADPNLANNLRKCSALYSACQLGYDKCVSLLLQHNADPNVTIDDGESPLFQACQHGHDKCVSFLLQYDADPNIGDNEDGDSPLHQSCQHGHDKCVSLLLDAGVNVESTNIFGHTPLQTACYFGHIKCVALLVEHGANVHIRSVPNLHSVLHYSCISRNLNLVEYILSLGVDINVADVHGLTSFQFCQTYGLDKCVKLLIEHGADESPRTAPMSSSLLEDQASLDDLFIKSKATRLKAKHCDYPDCCNEGNDGKSLHACSSCRAVYYCSREHQLAHWKEHKKLCKAIKK